MSRTRRPEPEGFTEDLELLVSLDRQREELQDRIDEVILRLTVEKCSPITTIAERLKVKSPSVVTRRNTALARRARRLEQGKGESARRCAA